MEAPCRASGKLLNLNYGEMKNEKRWLFHTEVRAEILSIEFVYLDVARTEAADGTNSSRSPLDACVGNNIFN